MKKYPVFYLFLSIAFLFSSCKDDNPEPEVLDETRNGSKNLKYLLRTVAWKDFGLEATYFYNPDSTLKQVISSTGHVINYKYTAKAITEAANEASLKATKYQYNNLKQITTVTIEPKLAGLGSTAVFAYQYNPNGTVAEMRYSRINEAGTQLIYTNSYEYNAQNTLLKVLAVAHNGVKITWDIESYSDVCDFDPLVFISTDLDEMYEIYNYPVLSQLTRLPKKIIKTVEANGQAPVVDKILETDFTINQEKLEKAIEHVRYPTHPQLNSSSEVQYSYL